MMTKRQLAKSRAHLTQAIRDFFNTQDFIEVETPILTATPGMEPHLDVFETKFHPEGQLYLNHSPELYMKRLLGSGEFDKIFQLTKAFRNGEIGGPQHNSEFTMLEWYRLDADYNDLMDDCETLITSLADTLPTTPWRRATTRELFIDHTGIDLLEHRDRAAFAKAATRLALNTDVCETWDDIFFKIFLNKIEPNLGPDPIFITDYPATQAALARIKPEEPFFAERFELYINGIELCNAFSELTDSTEQRSRLEEEQKQRAKMGKPIFPIDEEFLNALGNINSPAAGIALGVDRLFMLILDIESIENVLLFPFNQSYANYN